MAKYRTTSTNDTNIVRIENVDLANSMISVIDRSGLAYKVPFRHSGAFYRIPKPGETWALRRENYNYTFEAVYDLDNETNGFDIYSPGDGVIDAPRSLSINTSRMIVNGHDVGVRAWEYFESPKDYLTIFELNSKPIPASVQMFANGILVNPTLITIDNKFVKVDAVLRGWFTIYYDYIPEVQA